MKTVLRNQHDIDIYCSIKISKMIWPTRTTKFPFTPLHTFSCPQSSQPHHHQTWTNPWAIPKSQCSNPRVMQLHKTPMIATFVPFPSIFSNLLSSLKIERSADHEHFSIINEEVEAYIWCRKGSRAIRMICVWHRIVCFMTLPKGFAD